MMKRGSLSDRIYSVDRRGDSRMLLKLFLLVSTLSRARVKMRRTKIMFSLELTSSLLLTLSR